METTNWEAKMLRKANLENEQKAWRAIRRETPGGTKSTQSSLSTSLPALPTSAVFAHSASLRRRVVPPPPSLQNHHHLPPPDPPLRNGNTSNFSATSSDAFSPAANLSSDHRQMIVEEEPTTFIGIRSVLINGQRFFQPLNVPASLCPSASVPPVDPMASLLALSTANNGQSHPNLQKQIVSNAPLPPAPFISAQSFATDGEKNPPWLCGNPQPKNGLRGSNAWQETFEGNAKVDLGATFGSELGEWTERNKAAEQEKHRMELMAQVEEKRQRIMRERQREWEMEEKEHLKDELYQQRMRMELEEEKRREREKALLTELKMAKFAAAQKATEEALRAAKSRENNQQQKGKVPRGQTDLSAHYFDSNGTGHQQQQRHRGEEKEEEEQLEWWERKDRRKKQMEEANRRGEGERRTTSGDSRRGQTNGRSTNSSRNGQIAYEPTLISRQRTIDTDNGRRRETRQRDDEHFYEGR